MATTKRDPTLHQTAGKQEEVRSWLEGLMGRSFPHDDLLSSLVDGVALCELINTLAPATINKVHNPAPTSFKKMENVSAFLAACRSFGIADWQLFEPNDLMERRNGAKVATTLHALMTAAKSGLRPSGARRALSRGPSADEVSVAAPANLEETLQLFHAFRRLFDGSSAVVEGPLDPLRTMLVQLKVAITQFPSLPPMGVESPSAQQELILAREVLELATLFSVCERDLVSFERSISQLKPLYSDLSVPLPQSARQTLILGLNLLCLLAQNRIAEFHTELELISPDLLSNVYIRHPIQLEQYIMEGSWNKVRHAHTDVPASFYTFFMDILVETLRDEIAECTEKAFEQVPARELQKMLVLTDLAALHEYSVRRGWEVRGDVVMFHHEETASLEIPSMRLIHQALAYAKELERIV